MNDFEKIFNVGFCAFSPHSLAIKKLAERRYVIVDLWRKTTEPSLGPYNLMFRLREDYPGSISKEDEDQAEQLIRRNDAEIKDGFKALED